MTSPASLAICSTNSFTSLSPSRCWGTSSSPIGGSESLRCKKHTITPFSSFTSQYIISTPLSIRGLLAAPGGAFYFTPKIFYQKKFIFPNDVSGYKSNLLQSGRSLVFVPEATPGSRGRWRALLPTSCRCACRNLWCA